jgi:hypothetical protein
MLSVEVCKKALNKNGRKLTDEQIKQIRDFFYALATIEYEAFKKNNHEQKCDNIYESIDR